MSDGTYMHNSIHSLQMSLSHSGSTLVIICQSILLSILFKEMIHHYHLMILPPLDLVLNE